MKFVQVPWKLSWNKISAPTDQEVRDLNSETRKLPAEPEDKIRKFSKLLGKFHKLYLQDCKKAIRLNEVNERFNVSDKLR